MAHFAKLGTGNIVEKVLVVSNDVATTEQVGEDFLNNILKTKDVWKQTSYNTFGGKYWSVNDSGERVEAEDQSKAFRKNYATVGGTYDQSRDAFIPPKPYPSWTLNETTCLWDSPVVKPNDGQNYEWNEDNQTWDLIT
jgi:hypothetical protein